MLQLPRPASAGADGEARLNGGSESKPRFARRDARAGSEADFELARSQ